MQYGKSIFHILFSFLLLSTAKAELIIPNLTSPVVDEIGIMNSSDRQELEILLRKLNSQGKVQLQVLILSTLGGETIESASIKIVDKWKLGSAKKDNGVLFLVIPNEKRMRIEVGQGLEGALPDVQAKRILSDQVAPFFRQKRYSAGIVHGVGLIIHAIDQDFAYENRVSQEGDLSPGLTGRMDSQTIFVLFFMLMIILQIFFRGGGGPRFRGSHYGGGWSTGAGRWGSSGGGGWSGGGGGFSGGGASSDW